MKFHKKMKWGTKSLVDSLQAAIRFYVDLLTKKEDITRNFITIILYAYPWFIFLETHDYVRVLPNHNSPFIKTSAVCKLIYIECHVNHICFTAYLFTVDVTIFIFYTGIKTFIF